MTRKVDLDKYSIPASYTLLQAVERIELNDSHPVVVIQDKKVLGLVSQGDIAKALIRGTDLHAPISEATNRSFKFLKQYDEHEAFNIFKERHFTLLPVLNENFELVGVITLSDLLNNATLND